MINPKITNKQTDELFEAMLKLETVEDCYKFFVDLCTVAEIQSMSQRLDVARLLKENTTYNDIVEKTGASTATISRVKRCLVYGEGGYDLVLKDGNK